MKKLNPIIISLITPCFFFTILSLPPSLLAGAPDTLWTRTYSGAGDDFGTSVQQTSDGGFIIVGYTYSFEAGNWDIYLIRTSSNGDTLWTKTYGGTKNDGGSSIQITRDGGFIIAGYTTSFGAGLQDIYLIRTNSDGDTLWTKTYGRDLNEQNGQVIQTSDDGFIIVGSTETLVVGKADVYLIRTDLNGDTLWTKTYGGTEDDVAASIVKTEDGGFVIAGHTLSFGSGERDVYLLKIDSIGDTLWTKTYGGNRDDRATTIDQVSDGGFIITGSTDSYDGVGRGDVYLLRIDSNGDTLWTKAYGGSENDQGSSVQYTSDGEIVITGATLSFGAGEYDIYTICTNLNGDILWEKTLGGKDRDIGYTIKQTSDGGFIIVGFTRSFVDSLGDVYLIRLDTSTIGIQEENPNNFLNPKNFIVSCNNNRISIRYTLPYSSPANLSMYNIAGQLVKTLFNEYKNAGDYTINVKTKENSAGVYYFKITAGKYASTQKVVVMK